MAYVDVFVVGGRTEGQERVAKFVRPLMVWLQLKRVGAL